MNKTGRTLITFTIVLASSLLASALMLKFTPNGSWAAFVAWAIFFVSLQAPWLFVSRSERSCMAWLARFRTGAKQ